MSGPMDGYAPPAALAEDMRAKGIDIDLSLSILADYNAGLFDDVAQVDVASLPQVDGQDVIAVGSRARASLTYKVETPLARERLASLGLAIPAGSEEHGGFTSFSAAALLGLGENLLGRTAYGVLNGGSATSYADSKKNMAFGAEVYETIAPLFESLAPLCKGRSKGLTPAYINPDGSPGYSFLVLKMRARLLAACRLLAADQRRRPFPSFMPLFQMTSIANNDEMSEAFQELRDDPALSTLSRRAGTGAADWLTAVQPMISAYTHSSEGRPKRVFDRANGKENNSLALPGGHGQCFRILTPMFRSLLASGVRFAYIGNVDNLGYTPDPLAVALLALSGKPAAFEFALRTPIDVKGGILVETTEGKRTVADIGPAISSDRVTEFEKQGKPVLFNCATGLFDLEWLVPRLDDIGRRLPTRFSDQDKDAGLYSQAEQVTWEVTGILPDFLALAVEKRERFIAAKLLAETLLTSGVGSGKLPPLLEETSASLKMGLDSILGGTCGLEVVNGRWTAKDI